MQNRILIQSFHKILCSSAFYAFITVTVCLIIVSPSTSFSIGLPSGWEDAVVLVEMKCSDLPSEPCKKLPLMPDGSIGPIMQDGKSGCINFCKGPDDSCPINFLDFCKSPTDYCPVATGFLMQICKLSLLVSNRHVLDASQMGKQLFVRARLKSGKPIRLKVSEVHGHPNPNVDIAACQLRYSKSVKMEDIDLKVIPEDAFRKQGKTCIGPLSSVRAGDQAVFAGFPLVIGGVRAIVTDQETPLIRSGIVSIVLPGDTQIGKFTTHNIFLMDSWAFQGNSGSPVVIPPAIMGYQGDDRDKKNAHLVGVVSAFLDLNAPIEKAVVLGGVKAKVNSGLAIVQSLDGIEDIVMQFKEAICTSAEINSNKENSSVKNVAAPIKENK